MIYLDNAATTFPKPPTVINSVISCMTSYCGNPGRSGHRLSLESAKKIYECRERLASFFGCDTPTNVVFTPNTTYAINIAVQALVKKRSHVLISDIEHNSVYRTVSALSKHGIDYDIFKASPDTEETLRSVRSKIRSNTSLIVCAHASNVCGITLPISEIGALCRRYGIKFIVDGAQSAGTHPIDMKKCNIDALCCPGHKGLYGPQGTGFVIFSDRYSDEKSIRTLSPFVSGGNGMNSEERYMPDILPERFEAGTLNTPGIAGLSEGVSFVSSLSVEHIFDRICKLYNRAKELLFDIDGVKIYCGELNESSCLLFNIEGMPSDTVADLLNDDGICVRGGLHCAPLVHKKLKTTNGAVRASFSYFNTMSDVEALYNSVKRIAKEKV